MNYSLFSSESVCAGHPDKVCDQVSDAVLDAALTLDPLSRVACETMVTKNKLILAGEVTSKKKIDYEKVAREVVESLGYSKSLYDFGPDNNYEVLIHEQSGEIALGVDDGGAGDQGMMFGYACKETESLMPMPIMMAHDLCRGMDDLMTGSLPYLRPDGKSQVSIRYENGRPIEIVKVVLAKPFDSSFKSKDVLNDLYQLLLIPIFEKYHLPIIRLEKVVFNGTGKWEIGGPVADTGVTGRKIVVDGYGGMGRLGGGCFSGKDASKVDRSGAYVARFLAKQVVAKGLSDRCEIQIAYAIGQKEPVSKSVETFGTEKKSLKVINDFVWSIMPLDVENIIQKLDLRKPVFSQTARYGHFGNGDYSWEGLI